MQNTQQLALEPPRRESTQFVLNFSSQIGLITHLVDVRLTLLSPVIVISSTYSKTTTHIFDSDVTNIVESVSENLKPQKVIY